MAARVILLEISPRDSATGAQVTLRLAGGGAEYPYRYGGNDWEAGLTFIPEIIAQLEYDGADLGSGAIPQALTMNWAGSTDASLNAKANLHWVNAPFKLWLFEENAAGTMPVDPLQTGKAMTHSVVDSVLRIAMADPSVDMQRAIVVDTFGGTGGIDGPAEWEGRRKRRVWGAAYNIEGEPIDTANNIYCFGDPSKPWQAFSQVRDKGAVAASTTTLAWQGSVAATFTALQAAVAPSGGGVLCPSIACVKWWTRPAGILAADVQGEIGAGYTDTAAGISQAIVLARTGPLFVTGTVAAADAIRSRPCGYVADDTQVTIAAALNFILGGVRLLWVLEASSGKIRISPWAFTASAGAFLSLHANRMESYPPIQSRKIGYRLNHRIHAAGDIAAIVTYGNGVPIDDLMPAEAGANVTGTNIAAGITGQGTLATQSNVNLGTQVTGTLGTGNAAAGLVNANVTITAAGALTGAGGGAVTFGGLGGGAVGLQSEVYFGQATLRETSGGTVATLANFRTSMGTAAAIVGQGSGATASNLTGLNATEGAQFAAVRGYATAGDSVGRNGDYLNGVEFLTLYTNGTGGATVPVRTAGGAGEPPFFLRAPAYTGGGLSIVYPLTSTAYGYPAEAGEVWRVVTSNRNGTIRCYLQFMNGAGVEIAGTGSNYSDFPTAAAFTPRSFSRVAPAGTKYVYVQFWLGASADMGPHRIFPLRTESGFLNTAGAVNQNPDFREPANDGRPANWRTFSYGTINKDQLAYTDSARDTVTITASTVGLVGDAFRVEPNTRYQIEIIVAANGAATTAYLQINEYDSELAAEKKYIYDASFDEDSLGVLRTRVVSLGTPSVPNVSGGYTRYLYTYTPTSTAKWVSLAGSEFGPSRLLFKRIRADNRATLGAAAGRDIFRSDGSTVMSQAEVRTVEGTAAAITGQGLWATYGTITPTTMANRTQQLDGTTGRAIDGRLLNSSNNYGLRALSEAPTFSQTNAGSSVTLDLGSNGRLYSDWAATITLPSATITGLAYSTTYYLWRNMPDPTGAGSSYGYSANLQDALAVSKVYLGYVITMNSGGTGGGGGGWGDPNCVAATAVLPISADLDEVSPADCVLETDPLVVLNEGLDGWTTTACEANAAGTNECVTLTTTSGVTLTLALNTPMTLPGNCYELAANMAGLDVAVLDHGNFRWEKVERVDYVGRLAVAKIACHNATYAAGDQLGRYIFSHNVELKP